MEQREEAGWRALSHPAFQSIEVDRCEHLNTEGRVTSSVQTFLTCSRLISPQALRQVLNFLYTGSIDTEILNTAALKQVRLSNVVGSV